MGKVVQTLTEFDAEAARFVRHTLSVADFAARDKATLVTLSGELGAGKTAFVKAMAKTFGVEDLVTSPTFVLEKMYMLPEGKAFKRLIHIDAYRLEKGADLAPLGFDELMKDPGNLILFEWPERVTGALPAPVEKISFAVNSDGSRTISYG